MLLCFETALFFVTGKVRRSHCYHNYLYWIQETD